MSSENRDFLAVLTDMEAKRSALDDAITALRTAIAMGALGAVAAGDASAVPMSAVAPAQNSAEIPDGAFLGKNIPKAIRLYLGSVRKKQTTREIVEALKKGGIESTSKQFGVIVYNTLCRMRGNGGIAKVDGLWGLAEWYHPGMRPTSKPKTTTQKRGKNSRSTTVARARGKQLGWRGRNAQSLPDRIESLLGSNPEKLYTPTQIATALGVNPISVNVRLKRMVGRQRIDKAGPAQYRSIKTGAPKLLAAG